MPIVDYELLREIPLFELLDEQELSALAGQMEQRRYLMGQIIYAVGDPGGVMYIVQQGRTEVFIRDKAHERVRIAVCEPGDIFGEVALLANDERHTNAKALEDTTVLIVDRNDLDFLFRKHPTAALDIISMLGKRIRETDVLVRDRVIARNVNEEMEEQIGFAERLSDALTRFSGDVRFVYLHVLWFTVWIILNIGWVPAIPPFDPFPFGLLTMIVSLEAILLSALVLISQNRQVERDRVRNDIEYDVNVKAELEIQQLHEKIDDMQDVMMQRLTEINRTLGIAGRKRALWENED
ncbi:MAG: DUF1003 domain-containing protein [Chloroflexota bacterium]|nr:DUF1003 domain-containing protein [Chloroflexota bacterium]